MQEIVNAASTQFIDSSGKCRALIYVAGGNKVAVILPYPIHPRRLNRELSTKPVEMKVAIGWAQSHGLEMTAVTLTSGMVSAVHLELPGKSSTLFPRLTVPVLPSAPPPKIPSISFNGQLYTSETSEVGIYQEYRRIAAVLRAYALFTYSEDPTSFGKESFVVLDPDEVESWAETLTAGEGSHNSLLDDNPSIYDDDHRIKVPSEDIASRLLEYVYVQSVKNELGLARVKDLTLVPGSYATIGDFTPRPSQIIFTSLEGLVKWCRGSPSPSHVAYASVTPELMASYNPFFLRDPTLQPEEPHLVLIQPVLGHELGRAVSVSQFWVAHKTNSLSSVGLTTYRAPPASAKLIASAVVRSPGDGLAPELDKPSVLKVGPKAYMALLYLTRRTR